MVIDNPVKKIDHIGIAVKKIEDHMSYYQDVLGLEFLGIKTVDSQKVKIAIFKIGLETAIELLEPLSPDSTIEKFLEKHGEGFHHICYGINDIEETLQFVKNKNLQLIHEKPFIGVKGEKVAFLHPKSTGGVLTEFSEGSEK
ncbi:MAG: methylmalonyl-CoA epimerase [Candidatus Hodarchaeales archaeon]|jgi:methylmalonyl-CoA epimerase